MKILQDLSLEELEALIEALGEKKFRAKQIFEGICLGKTLTEMTSVPNTLKEKLLKEFVDQPIKIVETLTSKDGTQKFAFELFDGNIIEGVLMSYSYGHTLCVSTQVGCAMGCKFCASTLNGLARNLTPGEILGQILVVNRMLGGGTSKKRKITNVVLMGSGEPLENFENVSKFLFLVSNKNGLNISPRNISLSTCGIVPNIKKLAKLGLPVILTISLHASNDETRKKIMPIANKFSIKQIIDASKDYFKATGRRVIFEYALIKDLNDTKTCAVELAGLVKGFPSHVNIIPLNDVKERNLVSAGRKGAEQFLKELEKLGVSATIRRSVGQDIDGACGQLRNKILEKKQAS